MVREGARRLRHGGRSRVRASHRRDAAGRGAGQRGRRRGADADGRGRGHPGGSRVGGGPVGRHDQLPAPLPVLCGVHRGGGRRQARGRRSTRRPAQHPLSRHGGGRRVPERSADPRFPGHRAAAGADRYGVPLPLLRRGVASLSAAVRRGDGRLRRPQAPGLGRAGPVLRRDRPVGRLLGAEARAVGRRGRHADRARGRWAGHRTGRGAGRHPPRLDRCGQSSDPRMAA